MATVTHLISILAAALLAMAILWGEHYTPWTPRLDVRLNYVLGTLAMLVPYSLLLTLGSLPRNKHYSLLRLVLPQESYLRPPSAGKAIR